MLRILESQAPPKQTATDTINVLSSRLQNATLLEDRRAAILGLRSFANKFPASVASGALRSLISSIRTDAEDVDTLKVVLETLLMLFNPDESSPEASDEVELYLADEFTQRQDNITVLLDLLEGHDFYARLYSLQLISAISEARPQRTQECIFTAPLGISRLVAVLDDPREAVRNAGIFLLIAISPSSPELQKLVAFENAFDRIFNIVKLEGGLTHGGMVVEDCLSLLANLLRLNPSNQLHFRETGCVPKLAKLLEDVTTQEESDDGVQGWAKPQRDKNLWGLLAIIRLFLVRGSRTTQANQASFWQSGVLAQTLHLAFSENVNPAIRSEALLTCADLIQGNTNLQRQFADLEVHDAGEGVEANVQSNGTSAPRTDVISALLKMVLNPAPSSILDLRLSALECIKAYLTNDEDIRKHFLQRAIDGHLSGEDHLPNFLTILTHNTDGPKPSDPYVSWMAAVLLLHLVFEDPNSKEMAKAISEGDTSSGEEVITCVQAIASDLITGIQHGNDERISVGYLMLLCIWLFEEPDVVNDFLTEGSIVESLMQAVNQINVITPLVPGLCTVLLGIAYEFSTKDSPISRPMLHKMLLSRVGREQYIDRITKLREHPLVRDYEVSPRGTDSDHVLPDVYFDKAFIDFLKDNFSRLLRAIDRDPGMEIPIISNDIQKGISRELVDELRAKVAAGEQALEETRVNVLQLERKLSQEQADRRKAEEQAAAELGKLKHINQVLQRNHDDELRQLEQKSQTDKEALIRDYEAKLQNLENRMHQIVKEADDRAQRARSRNESEVSLLTKNVKQLEAELEKVKKEHLQDLETANEEFATKLTDAESRLKVAEARADDVKETMQTAETRAKDAEARVSKLQTDVQSKEDACKSVQTELDDLMIVLADLEDKRSKDKKRLKELGEEVSEAEDSEDDSGDENDD